MLDKVRKYIEKHKLISKGDAIIIGVSGGPDSMALLHIMRELQGEMDFVIYVAHLNHGLREEADNEEEFVRRYCRDRDICFYSRRIDIRETAAREKKSLEEAGRDCRYQYFHELMSILGSRRIATAHHQDDVAETVLLHLIRGTGIKGLRGIMPLNGSLIRPFLCVSKNEINAYLTQNSLDFCIDKSNYEQTYLRNRIRHELIPYLQRAYNPRIITSLNQLADIAREENHAIEQKSDSIWEKTVSSLEPETIVLDNHALFSYHPAYQRRIVLKALGCLSKEAGWNMLDVNRVIELAGKEGSSKTLHLRSGIRVRKSYKELRFSTKQVEKISFYYEISVPGRISIAETGDSYEFKVLSKNEYREQYSEIALDYDKIDKRIFLRSRREGDKFWPVGMQGSKKIKDYFIDIKLAAAERDRVPLLASDSEIYAVLGFRISQVAAISPQTKRILLIKKANANNA